VVRAIRLLARLNLLLMHLLLLLLYHHVRHVHFIFLPTVFNLCNQPSILSIPDQVKAFFVFYHCKRPLLQPSDGDGKTGRVSG